MVRTLAFLAGGLTLGALLFHFEYGYSIDDESNPNGPIYRWGRSAVLVLAGVLWVAAGVALLVSTLF